jgi:phosphoenolpyruvate carboxykinase (ATP)
MCGMDSALEKQFLDLGLSNLGPLHWNLSPAALIEMAVERKEGFLASTGALVVYTGKRTGRSPKDRYLVADPAVQEQIWWGPSNQPLAPMLFAHLLDKARTFLQKRDLFVCDGWAGSDPRYRIGVRILGELAWHGLFARTLFLRPTAAELQTFRPDFTILALPNLHVDPRTDGTRSELCIVLGLERRTVLIAGTHYAGEIKKSIFSVLNFLLPQRDVFPMHCAANLGPRGDTALFFGLSGTGKTTLSADLHRRLIGDDEHGWSNEGVFNFEGGCYAKTIRLSREGEPQIWNAIRFGSVLENVIVDPSTRQANYDDSAITENTRTTYPLEHIDNCELSGRGGHPANLFFLTCDAFGVLPPISKLDHEQAVEHFLLGYTAKVAGTEAGVTEPEVTFSTCFGAPFMPLPPRRYSAMLKDKLHQHGSQVWLVNTGWTGGPVRRGSRIKLSHTRALLNAALSGHLTKVAYTVDPVFGLHIPQSCPGVPGEILMPRNTWSSPQDYDAQAGQLAQRFQEVLRHDFTSSSLEG